jgi:ABC-2 type transport system permease protein
VRAALVIALRILRQRLRDRSALLFAVVTPLGLALAFSMLIGGATSGFNATYVVVDQDRAALGRGLARDVFGGLSDAGIAEIRSAASEAEARAEIEAGRADAGIVIPEGFTAAVMAGRPAELRILAGEGLIAREIARAATNRYAQTIGAVQLAVAAAVAAGAAPDEGTIARAQAAVAAPPPVIVVDVSADHLQASIATFYAAAMAIMFVFFATMYGTLAVLDERSLGTLKRLLAAPIRPASVILGSSIAAFGLGVLSMTMLVVASTIVGGATWGDPVAVAVLIVSAVFAVLGITTLVSTLAHTVDQATSLIAIVAISFSAIGGVFIPLSQAPEVIAQVALVTPHAWFLRAVDTLAVPTAGVADVLPTIAVLLAMGLVTGAVGLARARRALAQT